MHTVYFFLTHYALHYLSVLRTAFLFDARYFCSTHCLSVLFFSTHCLSVRWSVFLFDAMPSFAALLFYWTYFRSVQRNAFLFDALFSVRCTVFLFDALSFCSTHCISKFNIYWNDLETHRIPFVLFSAKIFILWQYTFCSSFSSIFSLKQCQWFEWKSKSALAFRERGVTLHYQIQWFCIHKRIGFENRSKSVLKDMAVYALTFHCVCCCFETVFITIFKIGG